ncbi:HAAS signaling domain-containing protein [Dietzia cinnamea]|uniref:Uncharacterized protein n=1 Tax=Dietzia cinnamea TaxID=321318 RepID=A0A4R3ZR16_9ACTN|nr:hypothetical protein [Dietzia cinnamea]PWD96965.1 hypothetical protein DEQ16_02485 [Dietzia maris]MBM7231371.1 hypothetical protein [Dietzia cinnamea]MCT1640550.1 hypothetical protein [Dietzia cinnamea]MCT2122230.1 hypothetical protein [Dietzia cinnamea]MCT2146354.1 hypothetical protein [Dietzia cinnamea]
MPRLTDRYIAEVVRHLPEGQRGDISEEIAATIDDMIAAELDADTGPDGRIDTATAEHTVLRRLGDPAQLARRYSGVRQYLVGPDVYPVWSRVLRWLVPVVGTIAAVAGGILYVSTTPVPQLGDLIAQLITSASAALLWTFAAWTLVVVIIERTTPEGARNALSRTPTWDPDDLDRPGSGTDTRADAIVSLVMLALLAGVPFIPSTFLYIGHLNGGEPLINPGIPTGWVVSYLVLIGALALIQVWRLARPGRSRGRLALEMATDIVFGVFLTALVLSQQTVLHPDLLPADGDGGPATAIRWGLVAAVWVIVVWDQVETVRTFRRHSVNE